MSFKPTTIYFPAELKDRLKVVARNKGRKISPQVVRWVGRIIDRIEQKQEPRTRKSACRG